MLRRLSVGLPLPVLALLLAGCDPTITTVGGPGTGGGGGGTGGSAPPSCCEAGATCAPDLPPCTETCGDLQCPTGQLCQEPVGGEGFRCVAACDSGFACGDDHCCAVGASCEEGTCRKPDLVLEPGDVTIETASIAADSCLLGRCLSETGARTILRYDALLRNVGTAAFNLGTPGASSAMSPGYCGDEWTLDGFVSARLLDSQPAVVAESVADTRCVADPAGGFTCTAQGLAAGSTAEQPASYCNLLDVTNIPSGSYTLELTVNPNGSVAEENLANNTIYVPVEFSTGCETGTSACGDGCCFDGYTCLDGVCMLPDLRPNRPAVENTLTFAQQTFPPGACEIAEGCVGGPGLRTLMMFEGRIENLGPGHLNPGPEAGNPLFEFSACHSHYHFKNFTDYKLLAPDMSVVAQGHKQAFCLIDMVEVDSPASPKPPVGMGGCNVLSAGWADIYGVGTPCQWIDVTDVDPGEYILQVGVNPLSNIHEVTELNNIVTVDVTIPDMSPPPCPQETITGTLPITITGTTAPFGYYSGSCGGMGPEKSYSYTAPTTGTYVFSTAGSVGDTVLHVHSGTCTGPELACNDDFGGVQSQVTVPLTAGQTVVVFADRFSSGGTFTLTITGPP
jgi:hypothetical protein